MIRSDRLLISQKPYAVDLGSYSPDDHGSISAVWFRRRRASYPAVPAGYSGWWRFNP
jgi:hypothetical protein